MSTYIHIIDNMFMLITLLISTNLITYILGYDIFCVIVLNYNCYDVITVKHLSDWCYLCCIIYAC